MPFSMVGSYCPGKRTPGACNSTVLEAGERLLADVEAGRDECAAWAYRVMQEQVPMLRRWAGLDSPDERESEIRARYGIPAPLS